MLCCRCWCLLECRLLLLRHQQTKTKSARHESIDYNWSREPTVPDSWLISSSLAIPSWEWKFSFALKRSLFTISRFFLTIFTTMLYILAFEIFRRHVFHLNDFEWLFNCKLSTPRLLFGSHTIKTSLNSLYVFIRLMFYCSWKVTLNTIFFGVFLLASSPRLLVFN